MAYGDFSLSLLLQKFNLQLETSQDYFVRSASVTLEGAFLARLKCHAALAVAISTEKARSEFIIAPLLLEVFERTDQPVRFFSGVELNPAPKLGLCGFCDFLYSLSSSQMLITAPFVAIVTAKNDNVQSGFSRCISQMIAAQLFNERDGKPIKTIYGVSTTGTSWSFMRLVGQTVL